MEDKLIKILETFGRPVRRQGSFHPEEAYPESFFTFWDNGSEDHAHYDNQTNGTEYDFDVNFYSTDPQEAYEKLALAKAKLKKEGFVISGNGHDVGSDEPTHTGRGLNALYLEK